MLCIPTEMTDREVKRGHGFPVINHTLAAVHREYHTYLTLLPSVLVTPPLRGHHKLSAEEEVEKGSLFLVLFAWMALHKLLIKSCWQQIRNCCQSCCVLLFRVFRPHLQGLPTRAGNLLYLLGP